MTPDLLVLIVMFAAVIGNAVLAFQAIRRSRGLSRLLAAVPLLALLGLGLKIFLDVSRNPTSHNLWPLELLLSCLAGMVYSLLYIRWRDRARGAKARLDS